MENAPRSTQRRIRYTNTTRALAWLMAIALVAAVVLLVSSAAAAATRVEVSIDTVHRGEPGDLFHEATIEAVGACTATLRYDNNEPDASDHPNTDIIVGPVTFTNVEQGPFMTAALTFTGTGPTDVATRIGGDGVSSGGFTLEVTCNPPTTTTTIRESSTTTIPESSTTSTAITTTTSSVPPISPTPTLSSPPVGGVSTGGGACSEGSCAIGAFSLSPLTTWLLLGGVLAGVAALGLLVISGGQRKQDPPYE